MTSPAPEYRVDPDNPARVVWRRDADSVWMACEPRLDGLIVEGWTRLVPADAPHIARMVDTLRLLAGDRCHTYVGGGWQCPDSGRDRISTTGTADQWCDACRAADALGLIPESAR
jgi:hypothetical protein